MAILIAIIANRSLLRPRFELKDSGYTKVALKSAELLVIDALDARNFSFVTNIEATKDFSLSLSLL